MILGTDGEKMSKSRGNVVNPDDIVDTYGADALRLYEMFMGPLEATKPWQTEQVSIYMQPGNQSKSVKSIRSAVGDQWRRFDRRGTYRICIRFRFYVDGWHFGCVVALHFTAALPRVSLLQIFKIRK